MLGHTTGHYDVTSTGQRDVSTPLTRQQDKVKDLNSHVIHLEGRLMEAMTSLRRAEVRGGEEEERGEEERGADRFQPACRPIKLQIFQIAQHDQVKAKRRRVLSPPEKVSST